MADISAAQPSATSGFGPNLATLKDVLRRSELGLAVGIMAILVVLLLPLPPWLLDVSLALSLSFSILILMTAVFIQKPLEFSSFPTVLLITTMLRLALNLASTRLILGHGNEGTAASGYVIQAFGKLIMRRQFRHRLHRLRDPGDREFRRHHQGFGPHRRSRRALQPGRDARQADGDRRRPVRRPHRREGSQAPPQGTGGESNFFGAMDGASKFVRGDAIAGLLIVAINVIGGIIIAVAQKGMSFADATQTFTLLTRRRRSGQPDAGADRLHRRGPDGLQGRRRRRDRQGADEPIVVLSRRRSAWPRP